MKPIADLSECLKDSPKFRIALEENEDDIDQLEAKLEKMVKLCNVMVEVGKTYVNSKTSFIGAIVDLSSYFRQDNKVSSSLNGLVQALNEITKYHTILIDQAQRSICKNLNQFIKNDIRAVKDTKRYFEKISDDLDQVLNRNSQVSRSKPHECEEVNGLLAATRSCFQHTGLDYVNQLSILQAKKRHEILDTLLSYLHAQTTFFHQGSDLCQDTDPLVKEIAGDVSQMRNETDELDRLLEGRHNLVTAKEVIPQIDSRGAFNGKQIEGYLFKRASNAFKTWNRRWFAIQNNQLVYRKRSKDDNVTVMEEDLRLCSVKPVLEIDRRFCFEILSPMKSHILQADSQDMYSMWLSALQAGINAAIQRASHDEEADDQSEHNCNESAEEEKTTNKLDEPQKCPPKSFTPMQQILAVPGNDKCCDCKSSQPRWASINLGITLCIECSGIHRSLGVHHSKVRSLNLDAWEGDLVKIMLQLGNDFVNKIYEAKVDNAIATPATPDSERNVRESWIKAKYIQKAFLQQKTSSSPKQRLQRQRNIRKLSVNIHRRPSLPASNDTLQPYSIPEKRSPSLNPEMNRKRSGCIFPELNTILGNEDGGKPYEKTEAEEDKSNGSEGDKSNGSEGEKEKTDDGVKYRRDEESSPQEDDFSDFEDEDEDNPNLLLHKGASGPNIPIMCEALALGADLNWVNIEDGGKTAIHQAICSGTVIACEYLFLNGAKNNSRDAQGKTPLHLATELGNTGQVCLLLKRGADQHAVDNEGRTALSVAVENANADIVTLLRIARFNEEMKETGYGSTDDTFNEVVRDFSKLASDNPDRLKRALSLPIENELQNEISEAKDG